MKRILFYCAILLSFMAVSCNETDDSGFDNNQECTIRIDIQCDEFTPNDNDLLGVQIYQVDDGVIAPYANGLFDDCSALVFDGYTDATYNVVATIVVDGKNRIDEDNGEYGRPFESAKSNSFEYCETELTALANSTATLAGGVMSTIPNVDRYYGEAQKTIYANDLAITIQMKRVSFGVTVTGELIDGESVTVKISGAPEVEIAKDEIEFFTLQYIAKAYSVDETTDVYCENINTEVLRNGASIYSDNILYKRNKLSVLNIEKGGLSVGFDFDAPFEDDQPVTPAPEPYAHITKVFDYIPAPGQFVNTMPEYEDGDTQETMNEKVLASIGNNNKGMITLGSYGGYVTVGFNHTIQNVDGKLDFRVLGNAFYSAGNPDEDNLPGGSCEPGIIMVSADTNGNGIPDDEWYEIQGSAHKDHTAELWYQKAVEAGNDVSFYKSDYTITYNKPESSFDEDTPSVAWKSYIPWSDNKEGSGYVSKNTFHKQPYFPQWISEESIQFIGSKLPQNGIDESGAGSYYVLYKFEYGYADNAPDDENYSAIDISWAVDSQGNKANLTGVDFIKIYNGVLQTNGSLGECSTEICGVDDLHVLEIDIDSW